MRPFAVVLKTLFPATCAVLLFGLITWKLRGLDSYVRVEIPAWAMFAGAVLVGAGVVLMFACFALFGARGALSRGPSFPDPGTLVNTGPYNYVRNPMALGLLVTLGGWGFVLRSASIVIFALVFAGVMHLFVVYVEEPKLERRFGRSYLEYKNRVGRWIP